MDNSLFFLCIDGDKEIEVSRGVGGNGKREYYFTAAAPGLGIFSHAKSGFSQTCSHHVRSPKQILRK